MQAVGRVGAQDIFVISAPTKHGPYRVQIEPNAADEFKIDRKQLNDKIDSLISQGSRTIDTSS
eukprot:9980540-Karenia_brevis.AAC.1